ncbi:hypothetical protein BQ8482_60128 [Mesorhizobium delmotii]|uniref:Uncharacterized protein n=1 Tax=Mesorhizobium delmotii TaxID=1631247 RepID=A0A2P9AVH7_9HYPH|nr:hypothetical protein BQ8482_60128 [Mesorhizobium delmotii]
MPARPLEPATEDALNSIAAEMKIGRSDLIQIVPREWLETNAYLPVRTIDEESETAARSWDATSMQKTRRYICEATGLRPISPIPDQATAVPDLLTHCGAPYGFCAAELPTRTSFACFDCISLNSRIHQPREHAPRRLAGQAQRPPPATKAAGPPPPR